MPTEQLSLSAQRRSILGKGVRFLRRRGLTPVNLYGRGLESQSLQVETKTLEHALSTGARTSLMNITIEGDGAARAVLLRSLQRHPVTRQVLHADFYQVDLTRSIQTEVPVRLVGEAPAAKVRDTIVAQTLHSVTVECLPENIPHAIEVDVSSLSEPDQAIRIGDLPTSPTWRVLADPGLTIVHVARARVVEEVAAPAAAPQEVGEVGEEGKKEEEEEGEEKEE